jgi:hypothetical protein
MVNQLMKETMDINVTFVKLSLKNHAYGRKIIDQTKIRWDAQS